MSTEGGSPQSRTTPQKKKKPAGVTPLSFLQSFFSKKRRSSRDIGAARQFIFFAKLSFLQKKAAKEK